MAALHVVQQGEYLSKIAAQYNLPLAKILSLNPSLRGNPNLIHPVMEIKLSDQQDRAVSHHISRLVFDGATLKVFSIDKERLIASYPAISGLPPNSIKISELIDEGRKDLSLETDYTQPIYQNVKDAGPIQEDSYVLKLKPQMPFDKSHAAGDPAGWGVGGWILTENLVAKLGNFFGGRFGFFIHHDGGSLGTSGCIGLSRGEDLLQLQRLLILAEQQGKKTVMVKVIYP